MIDKLKKELSKLESNEKKISKLTQIIETIDEKKTKKQVENLLMELKNKEGKKSFDMDVIESTVPQSNNPLVSISKSIEDVADSELTKEDKLVDEVVKSSKINKKYESEKDTIDYVISGEKQDNYSSSEYSNNVNNINFNSNNSVLKEGMTQANQNSKEDSYKTNFSDVSNLSQSTSLNVDEIVTNEQEKITKIKYQKNG
ncbi:hypothetical protein HOD61_01265 [archaeon]|nr:hypothetical protein [archaeon]